MESFLDKEPFANTYNPNIYISIVALIILYVIYIFYQYIYNKIYIKKDWGKKYERKDSDDEYNMLILDEEFKINNYYHKNSYRYF